MELPVAAQSYQPTSDALIRSVKRARAILARMVSEESQLENATAYTNPARPGIRLANYAAEVAAPGSDCVMDQIMSHFRQRGTLCHGVECSAAEWPEGLGESLESHGFRPVTRIVYLMTGDIPRRQHHDPLQIIPARAAYQELRRFYLATARDEPGTASASVLADFVDTMIDRLDEPRLELYLGRVDGRSVGTAGVVTLGNIGVVDAVYIDPDHKGRDIAGTLMAHTLEHCRRALFEQVLIERAEHADSTAFYKSLGFTEAARYVRYVAD